MLDLVNYLRRIQSRDVNETFTQTTDSLEAIRDFLNLIGQGLCFYGVVTAIPAANQFTCPEFIGLGAGKFIGTYPYRVFVFRDVGGLGAAPQSEMQPITAFATLTGTVSHTAFTAAVGIGDEILLIHPRIAEIFDIIHGPAGLDAIFALIIAMLVLTETGGSVISDGTVQNIYINNAPAGVFEPRAVKIDFSLQTAAETVVIRVNERIVAAGALVLSAQTTFAGAQAIPKKEITLPAGNRYGIQVTLERIVGGAIAYPWEVVYRA